MKKFIALMFGVILITGCSESEEMVKPNNVEKVTIADEDCGQETGKPCQTENCFRCNLKIGNNLTPINADTPYSTPTNTQVIKKLKTKKVKNKYINSRYERISKKATKKINKATNTSSNRYEKISKEAEGKTTKASNDRKRRLETMSKIVREIQPSESK